MNPTDTISSSTTSRVEIVNPIEIDDWDERVFANADATIFHSSAWVRVLHRAFGYRSLYFCMRNKGELLTCLPVMEIDSPLFGRRGKTLPFTDYCDFIGSNKTQARGLVDEVLEYGRQRRWKSLEMRAGTDVFENTPVQRTCYYHTVDLRAGADQAFRSFRQSTQRNIKRALKSQIEIQQHKTLDAIKQYRRLHCMTRKRQGHFTQPNILFQKIHEEIITKGLGFVSLAVVDGKPIAGAIYFHANGQAVYAYGASDKSFQHLRPNNLLMWRAIQWYAERGYQELSLGVTDANNVGLRQYKNGMATKEETVHYYKYDYGQEEFVNHGKSLLNDLRFTLAKKMPTAMLNACGAVLYKHHG